MTGFTLDEYQKLQQDHRNMLRKFDYKTDKIKWGVTEYWEPDKLLLPAVRGARWSGDCEEFAMVAMHKAMERGFNARLVTCVVETGEGHLICEVASPDFQHAYFFDNRMKGLANASMLADKGYKLYSHSPWNPQPKETRPWQLVA